LSLESLLRASSALVLFECRLSCPSNRSFGPAAPWYYSSAGSLVPRITPSGQQRLGIIRVRALLSLESLLWASRALVLFECGLLCPSSRSFRPAAPWYYSSAGYLVPRSALLIFFECGLSCLSKRTAHILRVRAILSLEAHCSYSLSAGYLVPRSALLILFECGLSCPLKHTVYIIRVRTLCPLNHFIRPSAPPYDSSADALSLESLHEAFNASILFECGRSVPRIASSGLQRLHIIRVRMLCPSNRFIRPSAPPYYLSVDALSLESLHEAFSTSILFECGRFVPRIASSSLQRLHIIRVWAA
jgi:hypothetical protein